MALKHKRKMAFVIIDGKKTLVPRREMWLYANPKALKSVRNGIRQAKARKLVE